MADNIDTQQLAEAIDRLNNSLEDLMGTSTDAADSLAALGQSAGQSTNNSQRLSREERRRAQIQEQGFQAVTKAATNLAGSVFNAAKAMYDGQKGAAALNSSLDNLSSAAAAAGTALALLMPGGPLIKGVIAAVTFLTTKLIGTAKAAGEMSDALFKGYQGLSQSGAAASDGLTGLLSDVHKLGMGFQEVDKFGAMVAEGRRELMLMSGTVFEGRRRFADMGAAMAPFRESLMNAGLTQEEINAASMGYLRLQSRIGQTQNRTANELAEGARKYLIEQDALTKITGLTRKEQEQALHAAMSQERFSAQLAEMRAKGQHEQARELQMAYLMLKGTSEEAAQSFIDVSTGMLTSESAQKGYLLTQGENMRQAQRIIAGQARAEDAVQKIAAAAGRTVNTMSGLARAGAFEQSFGSFSQGIELGLMSENNLAEARERAAKELERQGATGGKAADKLVQQQTDLTLAQQAEMIATQELISKAIEPSMSAFQKLTNIVANVTLGFEKLLALIPGYGGPKNDEQLRAREEVAKAESALQTEKTNLIEAERRLIAAKRTGDKLSIEAAEKSLEASKAAKKQAESKLLDAEVKQKYADDRAAGRTGAGMGGQQLRADGSMINPGDEDYTPPQAPQTPAAGPLTGFEGATGKETQTSLADKGLKLRPSGGDIQKSDAAVSPKLITLAKKIQESITGFGYFSGFNDQFHHTLNYASKHTEGLALDFALNRKPSREQGAEIVNAIKGMGASKVIDEYNNPSPGATAGHIHVEIPEFARGGIATGPKSGYEAMLHGTEAVVPLPDGKTIPVNMNQSFAAAADNTEMLQVLREVKASMDSMINRADNQRVVDALENSIRTQRTSNDILGKILQMSQ
jgi:hypothetical protein